ncbi:Hypothetical_protein [Hexamita inflata]|uniref:Hypothetical_protein n=1 Tax=Hexamita inflata TaxID=28002 RepID=A0AA86QAI5_9EUKA|nr:Hypothetical protein HINF_LOCUS36982 [Hexamita inflata]
MKSQLISCLITKQCYLHFCISLYFNAYTNKQLILKTNFNNIIHINKITLKIYYVHHFSLITFPFFSNQDQYDNTTQSSLTKASHYHLSNIFTQLASQQSEFAQYIYFDNSFLFCRRRFAQVLVLTQDLTSQAFRWARSNKFELTTAFLLGKSIESYFGAEFEAEMQLIDATKKNDTEENLKKMKESKRTTKVEELKETDSKKVVKQTLLPIDIEKTEVKPETKE